MTPSNAGMSQYCDSTGTTSVPFIQDKLKCHVKIYPNSQTLYQGLLSGQVDADFLDTAIVLAEAKSTGGKLEVVGQYKTGEKYGAIYPKGSANEKAMDKGIQTMLKDGTTNQLSKDYLGPAFGGDPASVHFCHEVGLDYVSCSPFRVPVARLAAAHAALREPRASTRR